ncbi:MAG: RagB/SusD family nutrient uptake outer membrane protein [Cyclobacteriaceae bacterium]|nr:RagB/SusD family nutrient uptake outer membrane protein [Cyclobacteriaceae bacterium]
MKQYIKIAIITIFTSFVIGCQGFLDEEVFTQYDPNTFLLDKSGVDALLTGAYAGINVTGFFNRDNYSILGEFSTDIALMSGGGLERQVVPIMQWNWDPNENFFNGQYNTFYAAIARANNVLMVASDLVGIEESTRIQIEGEARFIRAFAYYMLHNLFGPTPIIEIPKGATLDEIESIGKNTPRPTEEEYRAYVERDLLFAAENLNAGGFSSRANKGNSWAMLTKFYLNNKDWQKCVNAADKVLELNYTLYDDYTRLFAVEGENNNEFIFRFECLIGSNQTNVYMAHAFPPNYPIQPNWVNFGAMFRTYTDFYETFEPQDIRRQLIITEYTQIGQTTLTLLNRDANGNALNDARSFKYWPDPNAVGAANGNDIPYIRLTDIMLAKAEALNEIQGPNQTSIDLINQVRGRVNASLINLADYASKEDLRDFILAERAREFYTEGLRREDLIRHGKYIQQALDRGINAKPFQALFPLPQQQIDNNPNLVQNLGY